eukprot:TRINITY_DN430_c0_g1_i3.p1 TRINITY_DN430_c0_g1~~TRINITY_DN430_c0_g1_i3.p1  ORF type:complete len:2125 (+),score=430.43 TRINITY_DN430_c0_g1_i3:143-6517(+)
MPPKLPTCALKHSCPHYDRWFRLDNCTVDDMNHVKTHFHHKRVCCHGGLCPQMQVPDHNKRYSHPKPTPVAPTPGSSAASSGSLCPLGAQCTNTNPNHAKKHPERPQVAAPGSSAASSGSLCPLGAQCTNTNPNHAKKHPERPQVAAPGSSAASSGSLCPLGAQCTNTNPNHAKKHPERPQVAAPGSSAASSGSLCPLGAQCTNTNPNHAKKHPERPQVAAPGSSAASSGSLCPLGAQCTNTNPNHAKKHPERPQVAAPGPTATPMPEIQWPSPPKTPHPSATEFVAPPPGVTGIQADRFQAIQKVVVLHDVQNLPLRWPGTPSSPRYLMPAEAYIPAVRRAVAGAMGRPEWAGMVGMWDFRLYFVAAEAALVGDKPYLLLPGHLNAFEGLGVHLRATFSAKVNAADELMKGDFSQLMDASGPPMLVVIASADTGFLTLLNRLVGASAPKMPGCMLARHAAAVMHAFDDEVSTWAADPARRCLQQWDDELGKRVSSAMVGKLSALGVAPVPWSRVLADACGKGMEVYKGYPSDLPLAVPTVPTVPTQGTSPISLPQSASPAAPHQSAASPATSSKDILRLCEVHDVPGDARVGFTPFRADPSKTDEMRLMGQNALIAGPARRPKGPLASRMTFASPRAFALWLGSPSVRQMIDAKFVVEEQQTTGAGRRFFFLPTDGTQKDLQDRLQNRVAFAVGVFAGAGLAKSGGELAQTAASVEARIWVDRNHISDSAIAVMGIATRPVSLAGAVAAVVQRNAAAKCAVTHAYAVTSRNGFMKVVEQSGGAPPLRRLTTPVILPGASSAGAATASVDPLDSQESEPMLSKPTPGTPMHRPGTLFVMFLRAKNNFVIPQALPLRPAEDDEVFFVGAETPLPPAAPGAAAASLVKGPPAGPPAGKMVLFVGSPFFFAPVVAASIPVSYDTQNLGRDGTASPAAVLESAALVHRVVWPLVPPDDPTLRRWIEHRVPYLARRKGFSITVVRRGPICLIHGMASEVQRAQSELFKEAQDAVKTGVRVRMASPPAEWKLPPSIAYRMLLREMRDAEAAETCDDGSSDADADGGSGSDTQSTAGSAAHDAATTVGYSPLMLSATPDKHDPTVTFIHVSGVPKDLRSGSLVEAAARFAERMTGGQVVRPPEGSKACVFGLKKPLDMWTDHVVPGPVANIPETDAFVVKRRFNLVGVLRDGDAMKLRGTKPRVALAVAFLQMHTVHRRAVMFYGPACAAEIAQSPLEAARAWWANLVAQLLAAAQSGLGVRPYITAAVGGSSQAMHAQAAPTVAARRMPHTVRESMVPVVAVSVPETIATDHVYACLERPLAQFFVSTLQTHLLKLRPHLVPQALQVPQPTGLLMVSRSVIVRDYMQAKRMPGTAPPCVIHRRVDCISALADTLAKGETPCLRAPAEPTQTAERLLEAVVHAVDAGTSHRLRVFVGHVLGVEGSAILCSSAQDLGHDAGVAKVLKTAGLVAPVPPNTHHYIGEVVVERCPVAAGGTASREIVVHAILPKYGETDCAAEAVFRETVTKALRKAVLDHHARRVVLPVLGSGMFQWPPEVAAEMVTTACMDFLSMHGKEIMEKVPNFDGVCVVDQQPHVASICQSLVRTAAGHAAVLTAPDLPFVWEWKLVHRFDKHPVTKKPAQGEWIAYDFDQCVAIERAWSSKASDEEVSLTLVGDNGGRPTQLTQFLNADGIAVYRVTLPKGLSDVANSAASSSAAADGAGAVIPYQENPNNPRPAITRRPVRRVPRAMNTQPQVLARRPVEIVSEEGLFTQEASGVMIEGLKDIVELHKTCVEKSVASLVAGDASLPKKRVNVPHISVVRSEVALRQLVDPICVAQSISYEVSSGPSQRFVLNLTAHMDITTDDEGRLAGRQLAERQLAGLVLQIDRLFEDEIAAPPRQFEALLQDGGGARASGEDGAADPVWKYEDVEVGSREWQEVVAQLHIHDLPPSDVRCPKARVFDVVSVQRVVHPEKWQKFVHARKRVLQQASHPELGTNEVRAWHGSSMSAQEVLDDPVGLDFRYSSGHNMYGRGTYFSPCASYSDAYAKRYTDGPKSGTSELFLVAVALGRTCTLEGGPTTDTKTLVRPPQDEAGRNCASVIGRVGGCSPSAIVVYDDQMYPLYLVSYKS